MYNEGISRTGSLIDLGVENKIVEKKGAWFAYKGQLIGQGREATKEYLAKNPAVGDEIAKEIMSKVQVVGGTTLGEGAGSGDGAGDGAPAAIEGN
jgi:recombination protein RecA